MGKKTVKRGRSRNKKVDRKTRKGMIPRGIRVLIYYTIILAVFYLIMLFSSDTGLFFGKIVSGTLAKSLNLLIFLLILFVIYGLIKRIEQAYYIALSLYFLSILSLFTTLMMWGWIRGSELGILTGLMVPIIIISIIINSLTFWYIITKREYFFSESYSTKLERGDRVFAYTIYCFLFFLFIIIIGTFINFSIRITDTIDGLMQNINEQTLTESLFYCENAGHDRDICYVSVVTKHSDERYISNICRKIESSFYRFTCYQAVD